MKVWYDEWWSFLNKKVPSCIDFSRPTISLLSTGFLIRAWRFSSTFKKSIKGW